MVHNDDSYTAAQKFFYLQSSLEGPALELIRSIPVSDGNYDAVIGQLIQRYDNHSLVVQSHIRSILDCPRVEESNPSTLQVLYSTVSTHAAALKSMDQPVEQWDAWLITIVTRRLDKNTAHSWQLQQRNTRLPKYSDLEIFIASRCAAIETSESCTSSFERSYESQIKGSSSKRITSNGASRRMLISANNKSIHPCPCCSEAHRLFMCEQFNGLSVSERLQMARASQICFNCLSSGHMANTCRSTYRCRTCNRNHHSLLHFEKKEKTEEKEQLKGQQPDTGQTSSTSGILVSAPVPAEITTGNSHVFLTTALVMVQDKNGGRRQCRAILDSDSQINFVSKRYANLLQLTCMKSLLPISGIGDNRLRARSCSELKVESRTNEFSIKITCYVLPNIVGDLAPCSEPAGGWGIPDAVSPFLADPDIHRSQAIDLLIGGGSFFDVLGTKKIPLNIGSVTLHEIVSDGS
jgi:hypothetical protein